MAAADVAEAAVYRTHDKKKRAVREDRPPGVGFATPSAGVTRAGATHSGEPQLPHDASTQAAARSAPSGSSVSQVSPWASTHCT